jgi:hypothetical protein
MTDIPSHIKHDCQQLSHSRTIESINRICDVFGRDPEILASVASASMSAAFLMLYCAARLKNTSVDTKNLYKIWGEAMEKEFDFIEKGFDVAEVFVKEQNAVNS